jgi:hypothetical protein
VGTKQKNCNEKREGQEINTRLLLPKTKSKNINVSGFLSSDGKKLFPYMTTDTLDSDMAIAIFDDFASKIEKKSFVILDNAPIHTSNVFKGKLQEWRNLGLHLLYLPPYSPHLNKIELLWKQMKEHWLSISAYTSFETLFANIEEILIHYGTNFMPVLIICKCLFITALRFVFPPVALFFKSLP